MHSFFFLFFFLSSLHRYSVAYRRRSFRTLVIRLGTMHLSAFSNWHAHDMFERWWFSVKFRCAQNLIIQRTNEKFLWLSSALNHLWGHHRLFPPYWTMNQLTISFFLWLNLHETMIQLISWNKHIRIIPTTTEKKEHSKQTHSKQWTEKLRMDTTKSLSNIHKHVWHCSANENKTKIDTDVTKVTWNENCWLRERERLLGQSVWVSNKSLSIGRKIVTMFTFQSEMHTRIKNK